MRSNDMFETHIGRNTPPGESLNSPEICDVVCAVTLPR